MGASLSVPLAPCIHARMSLSLEGTPPAREISRMAQARQTRCAGCGRFIARRAEWDDYDAEERAYVSEWEEHSCEADYDPTANWSPSAGEELAYLASIGELDTLDIDQAEELQAPAPVRVAAFDVNPTPAWMEGDQHGGERKGSRLRETARRDSKRTRIESGRCN